jgi:hypothetical protein
VSRQARRESSTRAVSRRVGLFFSEEIEMKTATNLFALAVAGTTVAGVCSVAADAAIVFEFGQSTTLVTATQDLRNPDGTNWNSGSGRAFSETAPFSPASTVYTGPTFFGGASATLTNGSVRHDLTGFSNNAGTGPIGVSLGNLDAITFSTNQTTASNAQSLNLLVLTSTLIDVSSSDAWAFRAARTSGTGQSASARAVMKIGSQYYVSNTSVSVLSSLPGSDLSLGNLTTQTWSTYDPSTNLAYVSNATLSPVLDNLSFAGFLFNKAYSGGAVNPNGIGVTRLVINGTLVPEPTVLASVAAVGVLGLRRRR